MLAVHHVVYECPCLRVEDTRLRQLVVIRGASIDCEKIFERKHRAGFEQQDSIGRNRAKRDLVIPDLGRGEILGKTLIEPSRTAREAARNKIVTELVID